ncbi:5' nucleotidase family protein [Dictyocaulus viviparus]|uniref:5' nucleotidase family protein n=1 Tax=Dictyocaulus viviparus TaxID=29172 RepID=A0A0D8XEN3_DICVI|nr:5' nucleotidase family protein [Dictyocaulus viviparus]
MTFLLGHKWRSFFNITVVNARKPKWFAEGTVFRECTKVDTSTGAVKLGFHTGPLKEGVVYSGGSCDAFHKIVKARGKDVLYIGDHIFGDVLRSKKSRGWRTFLVVPELDHELMVWTDRRPLFEQLNQLDNTLADIYKHLDATARRKPQIHNILQKVKVERYADLYASSCYNLAHYPSFYFFRAAMQLLPHESTVDHASVVNSSKKDLLERKETIGQQVRGWTQKTSNENEFCHEEEEDEQSISDGEVHMTCTLRHSKSFSDDVTEHEVADTDIVVVPPAYVEQEQQM